MPTARRPTAASPPVRARPSSSSRTTRSFPQSLKTLLSRPQLQPRQGRRRPDPELQLGRGRCVARRGRPRRAKSSRTGKWDVYYQYGRNKRHQASPYSRVNTEFQFGLDAVDEGLIQSGPANGNIVCRETLGRQPQSAVAGLRADEPVRARQSRPRPRSITPIARWSRI